MNYLIFSLKLEFINLRVKGSNFFNCKNWLFWKCKKYYFINMIYVYNNKY